MASAAFNIEQLVSFYADFDEAAAGKVIMLTRLCAHILNVRKCKLLFENRKNEKWRFFGKTLLQCHRLNYQ